MPKNDDWFRGPVWDEQTRLEFFQRLARSRGSFHKAQYARIKAHGLFESGDPERINESLKLLKTVEAEWPEPSEMAMCYLQMAQCHAALGQQEAAIESFEQCISAQRFYPNLQTRVLLDFPEYIAVNRLVNLYSRALELLSEWEKQGAATVFPADKFTALASRAIFANDTKNLEQAIDLANQALSVSEVQHSGFRYHSRLGLVESEDPLLSAIQLLAAGKVLPRTDQHDK
ncbi:hypothetical protein EHO59_06210 [Leptospira semungkisensis]|uniref:Tetratricopeptide repeat protein n=1 Tax=Leptospira semungkisensis TaxID=2484985 RepID=A0A4R9G872_9LEPT|nr:tetratricopeptide repeat protein [Leptospira semungkisensis]TGK07691.1 hypothetical protein EHO59_06210 [Leptospira semungkisensis]